MKHHNHTQALFLRQACSSEIGEAWALFLLFVRGAWIAVPANTDLVWAAGECICKDDKVSAALQMARGKLLSSDAFFAF